MKISRIVVVPGSTVFIICFGLYILFPLIPLGLNLAQSHELGAINPFDKNDIIIATAWGLSTGVFAWIIDRVQIRDIGKRRQLEDKDAGKHLWFTMSAFIMMMIAFLVTMVFSQLIGNASNAASKINVVKQLQQVSNGPSERMIVDDLAKRIAGLDPNQVQTEQDIALEDWYGGIAVIGIGVADDAVTRVADILKARLASAKVRASKNTSIGAFASKIRPIIARREFIKTELLFDYPDLVMEIGWMIFQRTKDDTILAYIAGSIKIIPYLTAAALYAAFEGRRHVPVIVTPNKGELPYHEMLDKIAEETGMTTLIFADVSCRTGRTLGEVSDLVVRLNDERKAKGPKAPPFVWGHGGRPIILVSQWPEDKTRDNEMMFAGRNVQLDVLFDFFDKLED